MYLALLSSSKVEADSARRPFFLHPVPEWNLTQNVSSTSQKRVSPLLKPSRSFSKRKTSTGARKLKAGSGFGVVKVRLDASFLLSFSSLECFCLVWSNRKFVHFTQRSSTSSSRKNFRLREVPTPNHTQPKLSLPLSLPSSSSKGQDQESVAGGRISRKEMGLVSMRL